MIDSPGWQHWLFAEAASEGWFTSCSALYPMQKTNSVWDRETLGTVHRVKIALAMCVLLTQSQPMQLPLKHQKAAPICLTLARPITIPLRGSHGTHPLAPNSSPLCIIFIKSEKCVISEYLIGLSCSCQWIWKNVKGGCAFNAQLFSRPVFPRTSPVAC